jgi:hypothetical protein
MDPYGVNEVFSIFVTLFGLTAFAGFDPAHFAKISPLDRTPYVPKTVSNFARFQTGLRL